MRIKERTTCVKMSEESAAPGSNGEQRTCHKIKRELEPEEAPNARLPDSSPEHEPVSLSGTRLKCFKGTNLTSNISGKDGERDDNAYSHSSNLIRSENGAKSGGSSGFNAGSGVPGGRLKFFKDGKFILELSHRKDGEKMCWIPVPKKTYWPVVGTPRQESSASLSVSDDNSSIQSSPWQRDHCWKQTTPRQNISQELEFNMVRPSCLRKLRYTSQAVRAKRRKPSDMTTVDQSLMVKVHVKLCKRNPLDGVIQTLWERVVNSSKSEPGIVSPRKRILRELERVTLEEATKRQRARPPARTANSHSISAILAREDESVLRTLLRSPSPSADIARTQQPRVPASPYIPSSHSLHSSYSSSSSSSSTSSSSSSNTYYPQVPPPFRAHHSLWPVHYPVSSPSLPLPLYPVPPYHTSHWAHMYRSVPQDTSPDVPLNLSKHSG